MKKITKEYVERRLRHWADWHSRGNHSGLGYPPCSIEYRMMTEGILIRSTAPKPLPCDIEAEEIEFFVNEMKEQDERMALALRIHYFGARKSRERSAEVGLSKTQFGIYVDMARQWMAGRLCGNKIFNK